MSNPLIGNNMPTGSPNNRINMLMQMLSNGITPQQIIQQNPQFAQLMTQMKNTFGNKSPKDIAMQLAKQQGIDPKQLEDLAHKMGSNKQ